LLRQLSSGSDCILDQFGAALGVEYLHNAVFVKGDGSGCDVEYTSDFLHTLFLPPKAVGLHVAVPSAGPPRQSASCPAAAEIDCILAIMGDRYDLP